jgi:uncharacterized membrane protein YvbJ
VWDDGPTSSQLSINPLSQETQKDVETRAPRLFLSKAAIIWIAAGALAIALVWIIVLVASGATGL